MDPASQSGKVRDSEQVEYNNLETWTEEMAEDGLMLNFELPSNAFSAPTTKLKGGSWKDRLTARKSAEYGRKKALDRGSQAEAATVKSTKPSSAGDLDAIVQDRVEGRPAKRARVGHDVLPKTNDGQIITSLFSFNKAATAPREAKLEPQDEEIEASNAPLTDEAAKFTSLGLSPTLATHLLNKLNIAAPTAIQRKAVAQLVSHDTDAFIRAQTGSGKTLAYLLPIVERISLISKRMKDEGSKFDRHSGLFAMVLAPTRELARQIAGVLDKLLSCYHWVVGGTVVGGENKKSEKSRLRKGLNILVATPGRMADHLENTEALDLSNVRWLVLDEGDQLMDQGFEQDIQKIISVLNLRSRKRVEKPIPGELSRPLSILLFETNLYQDFRKDEQPCFAQRPFSLMSSNFEQSPSKIPSPSPWTMTQPRRKTAISWRRTTFQHQLSSNRVMRSCRQNRGLSLWWRRSSSNSSAKEV